MTWARTFGQMKTDLGTWLGVDTDANNPNYVRLSEDVREFCIQQARRWIHQRRDLRFFEATDTITTATGANNNGLPADYGRPYITYYYHATTGKRVDVEQLLRSEWLDKFSTAVSDRAVPGFYCIYGSEYLWTPTPDTVYTIYHDYFAEPADFTADADYDDFLVHGWEAIFWEACVRGCDYIMEDQRRGIFEKRAKDALDYLSADHARARTSGMPIQSEEP